MEMLDLLLTRELPLLGHRNWIVIADSAYPAQSRAGVDTFYVGGRQIDVVKRVLEAIDKAKHVRGVIFLDGELRHVAEQDAPGIDAYRKGLRASLNDRPAHDDAEHEKLIAKLDEAAKQFRILILKTDMTIPYTTVFIRLDCAYWSDAAEERLRASMHLR